VFPSVPGPSLLLALQGEGRMSTDASADEISMGDVLFVPADTEIHLKSSSDLKLYRAGVNSSFFVFSIVELHTSFFLVYLYD
jgi:mannose-6-phosphate isomerase